MKTVIQVIPKNDFKVYVYFCDGKIKLYDMSHLIGVGVFKKISNIDVFIKTCTVLNGTLAWDIEGKLDTYNCLDLDPETIYMDGIDVKDPNEKAISN
jgi:hypothetical protein